MLTREQAIQRLEEITRELIDLKDAVEQIWSTSENQNPTEVFLAKCGGWQDVRSVEEIIADIYSERTSSDRGATLFTSAA